MYFIDTHSHMYLPEFAEDIESAVQRAIDNGLSKIVLPNIDSNTIGLIDEITLAFPEVFIPLNGLHPTHVKSNFANELERVMAHFADNKYYGVGEIGVDLYWDKTFIEEQKLVFRLQTEYALSNTLPIVVHSREAYPEVLEVLKAINATNYHGIFHAFSGTLSQAEELIEMGFKIGIGGVITFKNSSLLDIVQNIDISNIVLETDSPYLAPVPHRGKRNESAYIPIIAQKIAEIKGLSIEKVAIITTENASKIFMIE